MAPLLFVDVANMITNELRPFVVLPQNSLLHAMQCINDGKREVALVVGKTGCLMGVVTDGDIRRGILAGLSINATVSRVMTRDYVSVGQEAGRADVLELMRSLGIRHVPVIDRNKRLLGIHFLEALLGTDDKPNVAIIMAGGQGNRLRPLTENIPKPMINVAGRPILERIVLHLVGYGIKQIYISVNYRAEVIKKHFGNGDRFGCNIHYLKESKPLGTGGPLSLLRICPQDPVLVMNGDLVTQVDVSRLLRFHASQKAIATMAVRHYQMEVPFGVVSQRNNRLTELAEKPSAQYLINAGIYVMDAKLLPIVPKKTFYPITKLFETLLAQKQHVAVYPVEEDWIDVGRREELAHARGVQP